EGAAGLLPGDVGDWLALIPEDVLENAGEAAGAAAEQTLGGVEHVVTRHGAGLPGHRHAPDVAGGPGIGGAGGGPALNRRPVLGVALRRGSLRRGGGRRAGPGRGRFVPAGRRAR